MAYDLSMLLSDWQQMGVFDYVLPFLLIFAFVYGVLTSTRVFSGNRSVNVIMAMAIGMLSLQFEFVPMFFREIFPRFGVGIAVFLVLTILAAVFIPQKYFAGWSLAFTVIGLLIGGVVIYNSFASLGWAGGYWWDEYGSLIILVIGLATIVTVLLMPKLGENKVPMKFGPWRDPEAG